MFIKQFRLKTLSGIFMRGLQTLLLAVSTRANGGTYAEYEEYGRCPGERPAGRLSAVGS